MFKTTSIALTLALALPTTLVAAATIDSVDAQGLNSAATASASVSNRRTALFDDTLKEDKFYQPRMGTEVVYISPTAGEGDDTDLFTAAMESLPKKGGIIRVEKGTYRLINLKLRSGVHFRIDADSEILPYASPEGAKHPIFDLGKNESIENVSIIGRGGRFTINMTGMTAHTPLRAFLLADVKNFKIARINIEDNYTVYSSLAFTANYLSEKADYGKKITQVVGVPRNGVIANLSATHASYGYGLVQVQVGHDLYFRNLKATGGVALRLETGAGMLQFAKGKPLDELKLNNIFAKNLTCINGQSALQLSPHTIDQGAAYVRDVKAYSCEAGVVQSAGFVSHKSEDGQPAYQVTEGLTPGSFSPKTTVRNVKVVFGQNAQLHPSKRLRYLPCAMRTERQGGIGIGQRVSYDEYRPGPSIASVIRQDNQPGAYRINLPESEISAVGFNIKQHHLADKAMVKSSFNDFELCNEQLGSTPIFIPKSERNTTNRLNPME